MNRSNISVLTVLVSLLGLGKAFGQEDFGQPVVYANNSATVLGQVSIDGEAASEGDVVAIYLAGLEVCIFERNSLDGLMDGYYFPHPERMPPPAP